MRLPFFRTEKLNRNPEGDFTNKLSRFLKMLSLCGGFGINRIVLNFYNKISEDFTEYLGICEFFSSCSKV